MAGQCHLSAMRVRPGFDLGWNSFFYLAFNPQDLYYREYNICEPHQCPCGASVDARGLHGLWCSGDNGHSARHHNLDDLVWRAMAKTDIAALKEPSGLLRTDGKRPDGVTLLPWKQGKCVAWDVTVSDTLAQSYVHETSQTPGAAAEAAAERKTNKYMSLAQSYLVCSSRSRNNGSD